MAETGPEAAAAAAQWGGQAVVKGQVLTGGRGKAGAIKLVSSAEEAGAAAEQIIGMSVKGLPVQRVLVSQKIEIKAEYYAGVTIDREDETIVYKGRRELGTIVTMLEASGRYCFRLGCDTRDEPRTYRGRVRAARALLVIDDLRREASKRRWDLDELIVRAWDAKPHTAPN